MLLNLYNFFANQIGWAACALGAGVLDRPMTGPILVFFLILGHLALFPNRVREAAFILTVGVIGMSIDTVLHNLGVFSFHENSLAPVVPPFMIALWINFATVYSGVLRFMKKRLLAAAALGFFGGPLAYFGGQALGAIILMDNMWISLGVVAVEYAIVTPLLGVIAVRYDRIFLEPEGATATGRASSQDAESSEMGIAAKGAEPEVAECASRA